MMTESQIKALCGWGVWSEDDQTFHPEATAQLVQSIHSDWAKNPELYPGLYRNLDIRGAGAPGGRSMLWEVVRKVLGSDMPQDPQARGDCVGVSSKYAGQTIQVMQMAAGERLNYTQLFAPYHWGMGRLASDCGNDRLGFRDGSMGAWQAKAIMEYGVIAVDAQASDGETLPAYSKQVAGKWGNRPGPAQKWVDLGKKHIVQSAALVSTPEDCQLALDNGYPVTISFGIGFTMEPQADGFHHREGRWGHQIFLWGYDAGGTTPNGKVVPEHYIARNQWGDVHGHLMDFRTGEQIPYGCIRIKRQDLETILSERDSMAYSGMKGFVAQALPRDQADPW